MEKPYFLLIAFFVFSIHTSSQTREQINFGIVGASYEVPISETITISPAAFTNLNIDYLTLGVKANYYLNTIFNLPNNWDFYGGANLGFGLAIKNGFSNGLNLGLQLGSRWFWNKKWGVYLEVGGGKLDSNTFAIGLTLKL